MDADVGDAYRYTLTPVFASLPTSFRCYLRRRTPDIIYRVSMSVTLPQSAVPLQSPTLQQSLPPTPSTENPGFLATHVEKPIPAGDLHRELQA